MARYTTISFTSESVAPGNSITISRDVLTKTFTIVKIKAVPSAGYGQSQLWIYKNLNLTNAEMVYNSGRQYGTIVAPCDINVDSNERIECGERAVAEYEDLAETGMHLYIHIHNYDVIAKTYDITIVYMSSTIAILNSLQLIGEVSHESSMLNAQLLITDNSGTDPGVAGLAVGYDHDAGYGFASGFVREGVGGANVKPIIFQRYGGFLGIGNLAASGPQAPLHVRDLGTPQMRLDYDFDHYFQMAVDESGQLTSWCPLGYDFQIGDPMTRILKMVSGGATVTGTVTAETGTKHVEMYYDVGNDRGVVVAHDGATPKPVYMGNLMIGSIHDLETTGQLTVGENIRFEHSMATYDIMVNVTTHDLDLSISTGNGLHVPYLKADSDVFARNEPASAVYGYARLSAGDSTHSGYLQWYKAASPTPLSLGYLGWNNSNVELTLENSAHFVITGGYLGVGVTPSLGLIDVNGVINSRTAVMARSATATYGYAGLESGNDTVAGYVEFYKPGSPALRVGYLGGGTTNVDLTLENGAKFIVMGGDVGIAVTSPSAKLHVVETSSASPRGILLDQINAGSDAPHVRVRKARGTPGSPGVVLVNDVLGVFVTDGYDSGAYASGAQVRAVASQNWSGSAHGTKLGLWTTDNNSTTCTERVLITPEGYVGLNGTPSRAPFEVLQSIGATAARFGSAHPVYAIANSPCLGFDVYYDGAWKFGSTSGPYYGGAFCFGPITGDLWYHVSSAAGNDAETATMLTRLFITQSGYVGIGTSTPTSALSFATASHVGIATVDASDTGYLTIGGAGAAGPTRGATIYLYGNEYGVGAYGKLTLRAGAAYSGTTDGSIDLQTNATSRMLVDYAGNVGIGTLSPGLKFQIAVGATEAHYQMRIGTEVNYYDIGRNYTTGYCWFKGNQTGYIGYVFDGGSMGVDTGTLTHKFNVRAADLQIGVKADGTGANRALIQFQNYLNADKGSIGWIGSDDTIRIGYATDWAVYITQTGNVGIGKSPTLGTLDVNGSIFGVAFTAVSMCIGPAMVAASDLVTYPTYGRVQMTSADATHAGYVSWYKGASPAALRIAYMGYDNTDLTLVLENSAKFSITGGSVVIGTLGGVLKGTAGVVSGGAAHADLATIGANDHHNQAHVLNGADHTVSGLTGGHFLKAITATTFGFAAFDIETCPAPSSSRSKIIAIATNSDVFCYKSVVGTSNRVTVTHADASITLSAPQDLDTSASPTFATVNCANVDALSLVAAAGVRGTTVYAGPAASAYGGKYQIRGSDGFYDAISVDAGNMTINGGAWANLQLTGTTTTVAGRLIVGSATGTPAAGTVNVAVGVYLNGTAYTNPDYVFDQYFAGENDKGYPGLMPIAELERYVEYNRHLPGQPKDTAELFKRSHFLFEKVEELTLYIIQLQQQINILKAGLI